MTKSLSGTQSIRIRQPGFQRARGDGEDEEKIRLGSLQPPRHRDTSTPYLHPCTPSYAMKICHRFSTFAF
jgi:hypothetical protein